MKKKFETPMIEFIPFDTEDIIVTSGGTGHYDANGKWHPNGNGNQHYDGVNYEGPNNGNGLWP